MSASEVKAALAAWVEYQRNCVPSAQQDAVSPPAMISEVYPIVLKTNTAENPCSTGADSSVDNSVAAHNSCCTIS